MIRFGPAGIPLSCKGRTLKDGIEDVHNLGLNAMEVQMVRVNVVEDGRMLELETAEDDRGRVIGRQGRVAKAMRAVLEASRHGRDVRLEIVD